MSEEGGAGKVLCGWPGKVVVVAVAYVGPEIKFFPLRSPNRFWPETCHVDGKVLQAVVWGGAMLAQKSNFPPSGPQTSSGGASFCSGAGQPPRATG